MQITVNIDPIEGSTNFSIQLDIHDEEKTVILDDPAPDAQTGLFMAAAYLIKNEHL